jgi:hypothetical protein
MKKSWRYSLNKSLKKEVLFYLIIVVILISISILNNAFWKIGKKEEQTNKIVQEQKLEVNNITYNVPFEEKWLE